MDVLGSTNCCLQPIEPGNPSTRSKWALVALAVASAVFFGGAACGGFGFFASLSGLPQWLVCAVGTISHPGCFALWMSGSILGLLTGAFLLKNLCQKSRIEIQQPEWDYQACNERGETLLHQAVEMRNIDLVRVLLKRSDTQVNAPDHWGRTVLHFCAAECGDRAILELLLGHPDIAVNVRDHAGNTPLEMALREGREELAEALLARQDIEVGPNGAGETPLHYAAAGGFRLCVHLIQQKFLKDKGIESLGCSPLDIDTAPESTLS